MSDELLDMSDMEAANDSGLRRLTDLAVRLAAAEAEVNIFERQLKEAQRRVQDLAEGQIPELMDDLGLKDFTTTDGFHLVVKEHVHASITEENKARAFKWFDEHGCGGMVKRSVEVAFNRDQEAEAERLREELEGRFPGTRQNMNVHPSTLRAWVKSRLEEGEEVPDSISVHTVCKAEIST